MLSFLHAKDLPHVIMGEARAWEMKDVEPGEDMATHRADDEYLIINENAAVVYYFIGGLFFYLVYLLFLLWVI